MSVSVSADASARRVPISTAEDWPNAIVESRPSPTVERLFRMRTGLVPTAVPYICPHPWAYRPFLFLMNPALEQIDRRLCAQICFIVSRDNACRFCYGSFRTALRVAGYSRAELDRLEHDLSVNGLTGPDRDARHFALTVSRGDIRDGSSVEALLEAGYPPTAIREIAGIAVLAGFVNRVGTMLAVPVNEGQEQFTEQWYFQVLQPLWNALLSGWRRLQGPQASPLQATDLAARSSAGRHTWTGRTWDGCCRQCRRRGSRAMGRFPFAPSCSCSQWWPTGSTPTPCRRG